VKSKTNRLVNFFATLATVEEVLLEAVNDWIQHTTGGISGSMNTVRARNSTG
jgi:hypothetical protein